ncbi:MAG: tetratricopeptide repeat protein [Cyclobacteriaceae bacterium]|nr:tetratricopeptide repeat protein [Cyclobacteriaceae bacterium]
MNRILKWLLLFFSFTSAIGQDRNAIDSLKNELNTSVDSLKVNVLYDLFRNYVKDDPDSALIYINEGLNEALKVGDSLWIVKAYYGRGWLERKNENYRDALRDYERSLAISKRNDFRQQLMYIYNDLSLIHTMIANYDKALGYNFESLELRESWGDPNEISVALNNIGLVYLSLSDFENGLIYFQRSYDLKIANNIPYDVDLCLINMGVCYNGLGKYTEAVESLETALQICDDDCSKHRLMVAHNGLGDAFLGSNNLNRAESEFKLAVSLAREVSSARFEAMSLTSMAKIYLIKDDLILTNRLLEESQKIVEGTDLREQILSNYALYTSLFTKEENYKKAAEYQEKYIELNKEIFSKDLIKNISRIQSAYEERENIKTIAAKDQVLALQDEIIARQKQQYVFIITITFLTLGLAFVMYRANQSQRKINQELARAKETIQKQNEMLSDANLQLESEVQERTRELVESNESLVKVNDEMDNFIYKTSHDIRGPLASLKGICNVAMMDVQDEAALDYLNKLDTSAAKLNAILSRLLIINQINHSILTPEKINFEEQVEEILELERKKELPPRIDISYYVAPDLEFRSDKEMAKIILENLIDNAIKYHNDSARVDPFVRIEIAREGEWVCAKVIDNGIGINEDSKDKIFQLFVRASERSDSGGIGLYLSKLATIKLGGDIYVSKSEEGYTVFKVLFPPDLIPVIEKRKAEELKREKQKQKVLKVT